MKLTELLWVFFLQYMFFGTSLLSATGILIEIAINL